MFNAFPKLRSRSGYTLTELLVVLALISIFGSAAAVGITVAIRTSEASIIESRFLVVSDTVNTAIRDILIDSYYEGVGDDGVMLLTCEKYSGWLMSLEVEDGRFVAVIHDEFEGERTELLLSSASYAELEVADDFVIEYSDGIFIWTYALVCGDFQREVSVETSTLNK